MVFVIAYNIQYHNPNFYLILINIKNMGNFDMHLIYANIPRTM